MTEPLITFDFEVGVAEVDAAHREIENEANDFRRLLETAAPHDEIVARFSKLRTLIVGHFLLEEKIFARLEKTAEGASHVCRHRENHSVTADSFTYAFDKLTAARPEAPLPNIIPLIPRKYLGEMLSLDREMATLIERQQVVK